MYNHMKACIDALQQGFVASCQPVDFGPMDKPEIVAAMAQACIAGGATALRIEGIENLKATRPLVDVPIIAILKRDLEDSAVRITPFIDDVIALKEAGADIIAIDATDRVRHVSVELLVKKIHELGCLVMADCSNYDEGIVCHNLGVEIIGTTLSGYTGESTPKDPDYALVTRLNQHGCFVMAEGRYNAPELAHAAMQAGASCVTVGSAITRIEHICGWFKTAVDSGRQNQSGDAA
ncbi:N-acetylmannosamine-6-phosphate 2-epimerase [Psychromonas hadalis]|uniref:N-acetylmannosamine-6-phosphate 2-epimerase n=1 Tax=Psychromonas hadalis TaxID=211669 RepID=UPI0003B63D2F|nr:N-acetylmannosamine-6-phosphate 2-epimerase [Psychromonas hadalis]